MSPHYQALTTARDMWHPRQAISDGDMVAEPERGPQATTANMVMIVAAFFLFLVVFE